MGLSVIIAQTMAVIYLSFGLGLILSRDFYQREIPKLMENSALLIYGGAFAIAIGYLLIQYHNIWENNWTIIITLFGWLALIKGIILIVFPMSINIYQKSNLSGKNLVLFLTIFSLLLGAVLGYFGFVA